MISSKDISHLNFLTFSSRGYCYLRAYKNEWVSKQVTQQSKGRSRAKEQYHAGSLLDNSRVRLSPKFIATFPQFAEHEWFYDKNVLKDRELFLKDHPELEASLATPDCDLLPAINDDRPALKPSKNNDRVDPDLDDFPTPTTLSFLPAYAVMAMAKDQGYDTALANVFGTESVNKWLQTIVYRLLDGGPAQCMSDWLAEQYLGTKSKPLTSQRISELYATCSQEKFDQFWVERFKRSQEVHRLSSNNKHIRYCAFDSTSISSYSQTNLDCAFGHAKQDPGLPQINLAVVMDQTTGEFLYAHAYEGSINDKTTYSFILEKMAQAGFPMQEIVLVTDRGYPSNAGINDVLKEGAHFLSAFPIAKGSNLEKWIVEHSQFMSLPTVWRSGIDLGAHTETEKWIDGKIEKTVYVHYYYDSAVAGEASKELNVKIAKVVDALNNGQKVDDNLMRAVKAFIKKAPHPDSKHNVKPVMHWVILEKEVLRYFARAGFFVLKSDCFSCAEQAYRFYKMRGCIEQGFDQLKHAIDGRRLRVTERSYRGRLLEYLIATSIRCQILHRRNAHESQHPKSKIQIPGDSLDKMFRQMDRYKIRRLQTNRRWQLDLLPAQVANWLKVFFEIKIPPRSFW